MTRDVLEISLKRALERVPQVVVAYLFGSRATGRARPNSDLDLAVQFAPGLDATGRERAVRDVLRELGLELGELGERGDVVDIARVGNAVAFRAVRDGRCVLCRDRAARVRLEATIARRYDDEAPYRELFRRAAARAGRRMAEAARGRP